MDQKDGIKYGQVTVTVLTHRANGSEKKLDKNRERERERQKNKHVDREVLFICDTPLLAFLSDYMSHHD